MIEQTFPAPRTDGAKPAPGQGAQRLERVFLARNGKHCLSLYQAERPTDNADLGITADRGERHAYPVHALVHQLPPKPEGFSLVVAQRNLANVPQLTIEMAKYLLSDPLGCGQRLRLIQIGAYLAQDSQRMVCVYFAPDVESVRKANRESNVPWEHLWKGEVVQPD